jgi:hypothetical protein
MTCHDWTELASTIGFFVFAIVIAWRALSPRSPSPPLYPPSRPQ